MITLSSVRPQRPTPSAAIAAGAASSSPPTSAVNETISCLVRVTRANSIDRAARLATLLVAATALAGFGSAAKPIRFTVSVSGDLLMHRPLLDRALRNGGGERYDFTPFFDRIRPYVAGVEIALCHLETPLGPGAPSGYPIFNTPPALAKSVAESGWDGCQTASNHSLDQGAGGIRSTVKALDRAGLEHTGSFASKGASRKPTLIRVRPGLRLGLVAYTDATNGLPLPAPWAVNVYNPESLDSAERRIVHDARKARRAGADALIVNLHWGFENASDPSGAQRELARRLTDANAVSAVVGQGPHVVQPIDRINGKFVVFSEGNLVSNQSAAAGLPAATQDGLIALLDFVARGEQVEAVRLRYVPIWVRHDDYVVLPALGEGAVLRESYRRTVRIAGRGKGFSPVRP